MAERAAAMIEGSRSAQGSQHHHHATPSPMASAVTALDSLSFPRHHHHPQQQGPESSPARSHRSAHKLSETQITAQQIREEVNEIRQGALRMFSEFDSALDRAKQQMAQRVAASSRTRPEEDISEEPSNAESREEERPTPPSASAASAPSPQAASPPKPATPPPQPPLAITPTVSHQHPVRLPPPPSAKPPPPPAADVTAFVSLPKVVPPTPPRDEPLAASELESPNPRGPRRIPHVHVASIVARTAEPRGAVHYEAVDSSIVSHDGAIVESHQFDSVFNVDDLSGSDQNEALDAIANSVVGWDVPGSELSVVDAVLRGDTATLFFAGPSVRIKDQLVMGTLENAGLLERVVASLAQGLEAESEIVFSASLVTPEGFVDLLQPPLHSLKATRADASAEAEMAVRRAAEAATSKEPLSASSNGKFCAPSLVGGTPMASLRRAATTAAAAAAAATPGSPDREWRARDAGVRAAIDAGVECMSREFAFRGDRFVQVAGESSRMFPRGATVVRLEDDESLTSILATVRHMLARETVAEDTAPGTASAAMSILGVGRYLHRVFTVDVHSASMPPHAWGRLTMVIMGDAARTNNLHEFASIPGLEGDGWESSIAPGLERSLERAFAWSVAESTAVGRVLSAKNPSYSASKSESSVGVSAQVLCESSRLPLLRLLSDAFHPLSRVVFCTVIPEHESNGQRLRSLRQGGLARAASCPDDGCVASEITEAVLFGARVRRNVAKLTGMDLSPSRSVFHMGESPASVRVEELPRNASVGGGNAASRRDSHSSLHRGASEPSVTRRSFQQRMSVIPVGRGNVTRISDDDDGGASSPVQDAVERASTAEDSDASDLEEPSQSSGWPRAASQPVASRGIADGRRRGHR
jgi:hypothetical protein